VKQYIVRRLLQAIPIILGITVITFCIIHATPGNPFAHLVDPNISPDAIQQKLEQFGLNKPLPVQYYDWLKEMGRGNMGFSIRFQRPVLEMILERMPATLALTLSALIFALIFAIPIGIISATRQYSVLDYSVTVFAFMGISVPVFFAALIGIYMFSLRLDIFPTGGMVTAGEPFAWGDFAHHLILPMIVLGLLQLASFMRYTRSSMLEVIRQDYIRTARAKGLAERVVIYKHALRNALIPVITMLGLSLPSLFSGAVVTETVFCWPGMGKMMVNAVWTRDYPLLMGLNLFMAVLTLFGNLLADVSYALVDPRIRYD